jgi:signal transduction histidine kinase
VVVEAPPVPVVADQARVAQVVTNLVDNAVKYAGAGSTFTLTLPAQPPP